VQEELRQIDTSPIEALVGVQAEQEHLTNLLAKAEASKDKVAAAVFTRVRQDYQARLEALEAKARPLRERGQAEQARLRPVHDRFRQALEGARLDLEELRFRHEVGELPEAEFESRRTALEEALAAKDRDFQEAEALAQRFVSVVGAAPEPAAGAEPAPRPPADEPEPPTKPRMKIPEPAAVTETMPRQPIPDLSSPPGGSSGAEETLFASPGEQPGGDPPEGTVVMVSALLLAQQGNPPQQYRLGRQASIGRVRDNDICIPTPSISRKHAVIALTADGYVITDLESGNGTFVNDERVQMRKLKDGDQVRLGDRLFVFKLPAAP